MQHLSYTFHYCLANCPQKEYNTYTKFDGINQRINEWPNEWHTEATACWGNECTEWLTGVTELWSCWEAHLTLHIWQSKSFIFEAPTTKKIFQLHSFWTSGRTAHSELCLSLLKITCHAARQLALAFGLSDHRPPGGRAVHFWTHRAWDCAWHTQKVLTRK